jgi:diacylglycerol kinase family enzyme
VETNGPRYAQALVSLFNFHACPDGIICVGGDGIVNKRSRVQSQSGLLLKHLSNNLKKK